MSLFHRARRFRVLLWLAVFPLVWLAIREAPFSEVLNRLAELELWQLITLALLNTGIFLLFATRWWLILRGQGWKVPFLSLAAYRLAGFGLTYFTPGPQVGGEPLQVYLVRSRQGVPTSASIAAVTLDKLLELQSNFAFLVLGVAVILRDGLFGERLSLLSLLIVVGLLALPAGYLLLLLLDRRPLSGLVDRIAGLFPGRPLSRQVQNGAASSEAQVARFLKDRPLVLLAALLLSLLIWMVMLAEFWLTVRFLGMSLDISGVIVLLTSARIAFLLPIPAGAGTLEAALVLAAEGLGISPALGIGISLLIRARDLSLAGLGLSLGSALTRSGQSKPLSGQALD